MKRSIISCVALLLGSLAACGDPAPVNTNKCANVTCTGGQTCDANTGMCVGGTVDKCMGVSCTNGQSCEAATGMCVNPAMPSLAGLTQIDRMGRPAVNTALTNPSDVLKVNGQTEASDVTKDKYNADANVAGWAAAWGPAIKLHLGVFDILDNTCGNQIAYGALTQPQHTLLSVLLSGDALQVDTTQTTCTAYLAAERKALGAAVNDCGGRKLEYDVVDVTYSALAAGVITGVGDGIAQTTAPDTTFPFFKPPV